MTRMRYGIAPSRVRVERGDSMATEVPPIMTRDIYLLNQSMHAICALGVAFTSILYIH